MIIQATQSTKGYYPIRQGKRYIVYACEFHINPNPKHSRISFFIEETTKTGRRIIVSHNGDDFKIIDSQLPDDWIIGEIDFKEEQNKAIRLFKAAKQYEEVNRRQEMVAEWENEIYKSYVISFKEMCDLDFFVAVHDDNMEELHFEVFDKYKQKYEELYKDYLRTP
jgi:hypothetical protein